MGSFTTFDCQDGFAMQAWQALPADTPKAGLMIIQEIFGVNEHIRDVADGYAAEGYAVLAPCLFDRVRRGIELDYNEAGMTEGRDLAFNQLDMSVTLQDLAACIAALRPYGQLGAVGYCYGGLLSYLSACTIPDLAAAVSYYGGGIAGQLAKYQPVVPIMLHFGNQDSHIPMAQVEEITAALPQAVIHIYDAGHGFNCDRRDSYVADAAKIARERSLSFLASHMGG